MMTVAVTLGTVNVTVLLPRLATHTQPPPSVIANLSLPNQILL